MTQLLEWLNTGPTPGVCLRRDGIFPMLSWRDLQVAAQPGTPWRTLDFRTVAYLLILLAGLPTLLMAQPQATPTAAMVTIPVLKAPVPKGTTLGASDLTTAQIPASQVFASTFTAPDDVVGLQTVRPLPAGQPLNRLHLRQAPAVARESLVTLTYARGSVQLSGQALALEDGQIGQSIRVRNPASRSTLVATVSAPGEVTIQ